MIGPSGVQGIGLAIIEKRVGRAAPHSTYPSTPPHRPSYNSSNPNTNTPHSPAPHFSLYFLPTAQTPIKTLLLRVALEQTPQAAFYSKL